MAELYGVSKTTILNYAQKIGFDVSGFKENKINFLDFETTLKLYEQLGSLEAVAKELNCSGVLIAKLFKKNNYDYHKPSKTETFNKEEFIKDYEELKSAAKMAKKYNCSDTTILNYAQKIGYDTLSNKNYKLSSEDKEDIIKQYNHKTSGELAK